MAGGTKLEISNSDKIGTQADTTGQRPPFDIVGLESKTKKEKNYTARNLPMQNF
jgi:hypothetical protein